MRCFLYILILFFGILGAMAEASEVLLGSVVAVNREQGRITLKVIDTSGGDSNQQGSGTVTVTVTPDKIPDNLGAGDTLRVWGEYAGEGSVGIFRATDIRKKGAGSDNSDPTGVRSRLGQGWQSGSQGSGKGSGKR